MLSVSETAKVLLTTPQTIRKWANNGTLTVDFMTPTNRRYFKKEQIENLLLRETKVGG